MFSPLAIKAIEKDLKEYNWGLHVSEDTLICFSNSTRFDSLHIKLFEIDSEKLAYHAGYVDTSNNEIAAAGTIEKSGLILEGDALSKYLQALILGLLSIIYFKVSQIPLIETIQSFGKNNDYTFSQDENSSLLKKNDLIIQFVFNKDLDLSAIIKIDDKVFAICEHVNSLIDIIKNVEKQYNEVNKR